MNRIQTLTAAGLTLLWGAGATRLPQYRADAHTALAPAVADENGDYTRRTDQTHWQVVDPDPNGLNCRMAGTLEDYYRSDTSPNILDFPVVATLESDLLFEVQATPAGWVNFGDDRGLPWFYVAERECFVRANSSFIVPTSH